ncbi:hypothetical protein N9C98_01310 [Synechococcus sp. AH-224-G16]|nr:hypothetical protein [Synechococcus sp. AH-224-G16]
MPLAWTLAPPPPPPPLPRWEMLSEPALPIRAEPPGPVLQPLTAEQVEAVAANTPLIASDYLPLLRLSPAVPTANMPLPEEWRLRLETLSPFESATGTGNQNYAINLDVGISEILSLSGFVTRADDPLNATLKDFDIQPANFWESYGVAARWRLLNNDNLSFALNSSLETWKVGSGGRDTFATQGGSNESPNIFNDSGKRVTTTNLVGSLSFPLSWKATRDLQLTFASGVSWLPATQGSGQGGSGTFYGTNAFVSGGASWQPTPLLDLIATAALPLGPGNNNFDTNLKFSRVPILAAGLNLNLNPRFALNGLLTNGFGATPATSLLTLPSDNGLGYSASFVLTPDAPDTPQIPLTAFQRSLAKGGLSVNTALVPPDGESDLWISADSSGTVDAFWGYSFSNIFQFDLSLSLPNNVPQDTPQTRSFAEDGSQNFRGGGKLVFLSPLRGAPFWAATHITFGRSIKSDKSSAPGYLMAELMSTWQANSKLAFNFNPKIAQAGVGNLWGSGVSANIKLAPRWELVPETNIVANNISQSNGTLALRWTASDALTIDVYGTTTASMIDIGTLTTAESVRIGGRLTYSF